MGYWGHCRKKCTKCYWRYETPLSITHVPDFRGVCVRWCGGKGGGGVNQGTRDGGRERAWEGREAGRLVTA